MKQPGKYASVLALLLAALPALGSGTGADTGYSGAPGDETCTACHGNGTVNSGPGNVRVAFPESSWTPGQKYRLQATITDPNARRWGFQLVARRASDPARQQAGTLASSDGNTQVKLVAGFQWITHTANGTRPGSSGPTTFEFDWTAPAAGAGGVTFYVAANAANNSGTADVGDRIYASSLTVPEATATDPAPALRSSQPVLPSFGGKAENGFASNGYLEIYGTNLAKTTRTWAGTDFNGPNAPTTLDGVRVTVDGKDAAIYFVSPTQININTPSDPATGPVAIQVIRDGQTSNPVLMNKGTTAPALLTTPAFLVGGRQYVVGLLPTSTSNGPFVGAPGLIAGVPFQSVKPGDDIIFYALGCGPTNPETRGGVVAAANSPVTSTYELRIGGAMAKVNFFGIVAGAIGLYQINAVVPNVGTGDQTVELTVGGVSTGQQLFLSGVAN